MRCLYRAESMEGVGTTEAVLGDLDRPENKDEGAASTIWWGYSVNQGLEFLYHLNPCQCCQVEPRKLAFLAAGDVQRWRVDMKAKYRFLIFSQLLLHFANIFWVNQVRSVFKIVNSFYPGDFPYTTPEPLLFMLSVDGLFHCQIIFYLHQFSIYFVLTCLKGIQDTACSKQANAWHQLGLLMLLMLLGHREK